MRRISRVLFTTPTLRGASCLPRTSHSHLNRCQSLDGKTTIELRFEYLEDLVLCWEYLPCAVVPSRNSTTLPMLLRSASYRYRKYFHRIIDDITSHRETFHVFLLSRSCMGYRAYKSA
ncbi:hypothetical protein VNO77_05459 [Canavalia gladiata]|uniref:Uncharacterized protein n=1 Tax=Canavalia gladiata TaxID=3824 RepID=A0AAN9R5P7_CANGL